jgi:hypothetical protein
VSFAAIILCVASQRVFYVVVISLSTHSGNFWIHPRFREVGLEVNTGKTRYMIVIRHQDTGQNHNLPTDDKSFEKVAKFTHMHLRRKEIYIKFGKL